MEPGSGREAGSATGAGFEVGSERQADAGTGIGAETGADAVSCAGGGEVLTGRVTLSARQRQVIDAAVPLILAEGVGVSTAAIARAAGVSNGTLFNTFATKQALIDAIFLFAKGGMFDALMADFSGGFDRTTLHRFWSNYLAWGRACPALRQIVTVLVESGLASEGARAQGEAMFAPLGAWFEEAFGRGVLCGPSVAYIGQLILLQTELVITENLTGEGESLAFEMLCRSLGLEDPDHE